MRSHIQFITTPTADTPGTSLLLHFDDKRYVIGQAHEGLQRAGLQLGTRFLKTNDFFITGKTEWKNTGGLLGMVLTLADGHNAAKASRVETNRLRIARAKEREEEEARRLESKASPGQKGSKPRVSNSNGPSATSKDIDSKSFQGVEDPRLRIHGGPNLLHTLATSRSFIFRQGMPLDVSEFSSKELASRESKDIDPDFQDSRIQLWALPALPLLSSHTGATSRPTSPRKRSLAEYMAGQRSVQEDIQKQSNGWQEYRDSKYEEDQEVRHAVVSEMFDSTWRKDAVVGMKLEDVKLPATIFLRDPDTQGLMKYGGPLPGQANCDLTKLVLVRKPWPGALTKDLPPTKPSPVSMSYIVKTHPQRGKFRPDEAKKLGVPPGPLFSRLSQGFDVELQNGKTVTPDMVLEPSKEGTGVAILDVPSVEYLPSLFNRPEWLNENVTKGLGAFIWLLGPNVAQNDLLESFMKDFKDVKHLVSSPDTCTNGLAMTGAAAESLRHRQIYLDQFPPLQREVIPPSPTTATDVAKPVTPFMVARQGLKLQLQPSVSIDESGLLEALDEAKIQSEIPEEVIRLAQQAHEDISSEGQNDTGSELESPESEIITLGTGSALPSQYRNVSGTIVRVPGCGSYLLDCGENTLGQLRRMYPPEKVREILRDIKVIWISHNHADHHLGMTSMIRAWYEAMHQAKPPEESHAADEEVGDPVKALGKDGRLFVISNEYMLRWLKEYSTGEDFGYDWVVPIAPAWGPTTKGTSFRLDWNGVNVGPTSGNRELFKAFSAATGLHNLSFCLVEHCTWAYAVSMTCNSSFKFSYSGDCRPSAHFASIGKDSTVLIHEATFDDELQGEAMAKKHSTISEAVAVGVAMRAKRILLTHFSQRYAKLPKVDDLDRTISLVGPEKLSDAGEPEGTDETANDGPPAVANEVHSTPSNMQNPQEERPTATEAPPPNDSMETSVETLPSPKRPSRTDRIDLAAALEDAKNVKVGIAFDYMCVKVKDIELLEKFTPAMRELYKDREPVPEDDDENNSAARAAEEREAAQRKYVERQKERARKQQAKAKKLGNGATPTKELSVQNEGAKEDANGDGSEAQNGVLEEGEKMAAVG